MAVIPFDNTYAHDLEGLYVPWQPKGFPDPQLVIRNDSLARELKLNLDELDLAEIVAGNLVPDGAEPLAQAYAGHQFGSFNPQLGDGRALLLGEVLDERGCRRDIQLKGSGATPFSRGGDGRATLGPILREYLMGEAMHSLGVPTTRALAAVTTGEKVTRTASLPGAVLARVASSHLRIGTFEFFAARSDLDKLRRLTDYAIARHYSEQVESENSALALLRGVALSQANLIAQWMGFGFIHGVMNTDNVTISGETIDYGPCAFMDVFDPATVFSSIDRRGRYAYGNQPVVGAWNLTRLADALLPLIDSDADRAIEKVQAVIDLFLETHREERLALMRQKLGLTNVGTVGKADSALVDDLLEVMKMAKVDFTSGLRSLSQVLTCESADAAKPFASTAGFPAWVKAWIERLGDEGRGSAEVASEMNRVNPIYIPRNHKVEEALAAAIVGDLAPYLRFLEILRTPFDQQNADGYADPAPASFAPYQTFCGT